MDAAQAKAYFKQADDLYNAGRFAEALPILAELNKAFPNQKNVIWPSALCLGKLGRHEEAIRACDLLIAQYGDARAQDLRGRLLAHRQAGGTPPPLPQADMLDGPIGLDAIDAMLDRPERAPRVVRKAEPDYKKLGLIGGGVLVALLLVMVPFLGGGGATPAGSAPTTLSEGQVAWLEEIGVPSEEIPAMTPREADIIMAMHAVQQDPTSENLVSFFGVLLKISEPTWGKLIVFLLLISYFMSVFSYGPALFGSLAILKKLPSDDLQENVIEVTFFTMILSALALTCFGALAIPFLLAKRFEMSFGETSICVILNFVFATIIGWGLNKVLFMALA